MCLKDTMLVSIFDTVDLLYARTKSDDEMLKSRCEDEYLMRLKGRDASILMKFEPWCEFDDEMYEFHIISNDVFIKNIAKFSPAAQLF